jgi:hypothetical protein
MDASQFAKEWRYFSRPLELKVETAKLTVKTACVFHNYLKSKNCEENFECLLEPANFAVGVFRIRTCILAGQLNPPLRFVKRLLRFSTHINKTHNHLFIPNETSPQKVQVCFVSFIID